jgi:hypothetical protein
MLKLTTKILFLALFLSIQTSFAQADQKWVSALMFNGPGNQNTSEYYGLIDSTTLDQITRERDDKAMFQLSSIYWFDGDGKLVQMQNLATTRGTKYGYLNTEYFRQDCIDRITLLDKDYVQNLLQGNGKPQ